jgi:hypothetical protein
MSSHDTCSHKDKTSNTELAFNAGGVDIISSSDAARKSDLGVPKSAFEVANGATSTTAISKKQLQDNPAEGKTDGTVKKK